MQGYLKVDSRLKPEVVELCKEFMELGTVHAVESEFTYPWSVCRLDHPDFDVADAYYELTFKPVLPGTLENSSSNRVYKVDTLKRFLSNKDTETVKVYT